jgi:hypothetical protein
MPRTALEAFRTGPHREPFQRIAESASFDSACEYALLAFVEQAPDATGDPNMLWATHSQTVGARRVLEILRTIHLLEEPKKTLRTPNLKPPS